MCFWIVGTIAKKSGKLLLTVDLKSQRVSERTAGCVFLVKLPQILQKAGNGNDWMNMQPCSQKARIKSAHIREIRKKGMGPCCRYTCQKTVSLQSYHCS